MTNDVTVSHGIRATRHVRRRGVATLWFILLLPVLLILLCVVIEVANLWMARLELENAMEAAALAAVTEWGQTNDKTNARLLGVQYAATNSVRGFAVANGPYGSFTTNQGSLDVNENAACTATPIDNTVPYPNLILGSVDATSLEFCSNKQPGCGGGNVRIIATGAFGSANGGFFEIYFDDDTTTGSDDDLIITEVRIDLKPSAPACVTNGGRFQVDSENAPKYTESGTIVPLSAVATVLVGTLTPPVLMPFSPTCASGEPNYLIFSFPNTPAPAPPTASYPNLSDFNVNDYFYINAKTKQLKPGNAVDDGDDLGVIDPPHRTELARATVTFRRKTDPTFVQVRTANFNNCDPAVALPNCEDQTSTARISSAGGGNLFAVRAQAKWTAPGGVGGLFNPFLDRRIYAEATAVFDCSDSARCPRLIRVATINCNCP